MGFPVPLVTLTLLMAPVFALPGPETPLDAIKRPSRKGPDAKEFRPSPGKRRSG